MNLKNKKIKIKLGVFLIFFFIFGQWIQPSLASSSQLQLEQGHDEAVLDYDLLLEQFWNFKGPISLTKMLSRDLSLLGEDLDKEESLLRNSEAVAQLQKIYTSYHNSRNIKEIPSRVSHVNEFKLTSIVDIGLTDSSQEASELFIRSAMVNANLGEVLNFLEKELQNSSQVFLKHKLTQYRLDTGDQNFDNFKDKSYVEIFEQLKRFKIPRYEEKAEESLTEKGKLIADEFLLQELESVIFNQKLDQFSNDKIQPTALEQHVNKTITFLNAMSIIQENMLKFIEGVKENQKVILDQVKELNSTNVDEDIKNLPIKIFNAELTLEEILEAIESEEIPQDIISPSELRALKIHVANQRNIKLFNDMTTGMGSVAAILNDEESTEIQIPEKILSATNNIFLSTSSNLIQNQTKETQTNLYKSGGSTNTTNKPPSSGMSGTTIGGIIIAGFVGVFTAMFGHDKKEKKRHKQVMDKLNDLEQKIEQSKGEIIAGQEEIKDLLNKNQKEILEALEKVIDIQKELYIALSDKINENHVETQERFDRLENIISNVDSRISSVAYRKIADCYDLLGELEQLKRENAGPAASSAPYLLKSSLKYSDYKKIFNNFSESFARCKEGLYDITAPNVVESPISLNVAFLLKNSNTKLFPNQFSYYDENNQDFLNEIYTPAFSLLKKHIHLILNKPKNKILDQDMLLALESFSEISFSETDLDVKLSHLSQLERNQTPEIFYQLKEFQFLKDYIVPQVTINVARYIMNLYPFFDIKLNQEGLLPDYNVLVSNRSMNQSISKQSLILLKRLRQIVRLSMIQENIISGDFMLPIYYKILMDPNHIEYEEVKRIIKASGPKSILVKNLTHYAIFKSFNKEDETYEYDENNMILINRPLKTYQEAFENEDLLGFQTLFNHQYDVKHLDDKSLDSFWNYFAFPSISKNLTFSLSNVPFLMPSPNQIASQTFQKSRYYQILSDLSQYIDECILDYKFNESLSEEEVQTLNQSMIEL